MPPRPLPVCTSADDAKLPTLCKADGSDPEPGTEAAQEGPYWSLMFEVSSGLQWNSWHAAGCEIKSQAPRRHGGAPARSLTSAVCCSAHSLRLCFAASSALRKQSRASLRTGAFNCGLHCSSDLIHLLPCPAWSSSQVSESQYKPVSQGAVKLGGSAGGHRTAAAAARSPWVQLHPHTAVRSLSNPLGFALHAVHPS